MSAAIALDERERGWLAGSDGAAMQLAMRLLLRAAELMEASELIPVSFAHLDACFYTGEAHVDFACYLRDHGARFAVPTWTNVGLVSLDDPDLRRESDAPEMVAGARRLMEIYAELGAKPVWTCAPYQLPGRPRLGDHIIAGESNAVTFYNSVLGARTNKYGDYLDVACAMVGKAPRAGLHLDAARVGDMHFDLADIPDELRRRDIFYHLLGHHIGKRAGQRIPVISGLSPTAREDDLKAVSAAVAASGGVELWHGVGLTPEAPDLAAAFSGRVPVAVEHVTRQDLLESQRELSSGRDGPLAMVALGTPHFSYAEFSELASLLAGRSIASGVKLYVSTSRAVRELAAARGWIEALERAGATIVVDTCTYYAPAVRGASGRVMTNAAKWAYYAPGLLGVEVVFGSLRECVESAVRGDVWRDRHLWDEIGCG
jgi:predicted aconitase